MKGFPNWPKTRDSPAALEDYQTRIATLISPFLGNQCTSIEEVNSEIKLVCKAVKQASITCLSLRQVKKAKKRWFKDVTLSRLAANKKRAWDVWKQAGQPHNGPTYDAKIRTRTEFTKRISFCQGAQVRKLLQHFDKQFKCKQSGRFKLPAKRRIDGQTLCINGSISSDPSKVLDDWFLHFKQLLSENADKFLILSDLKAAIEEGFEKDDDEEIILGVPFTLE